jgi:hypothetical protein
MIESSSAGVWRRAGATAGAGTVLLLAGAAAEQLSRAEQLRGLPAEGLVLGVSVRARAADSPHHEGSRDVRRRRRDLEGNLRERCGAARAQGHIKGCSRR